MADVELEIIDIPTNTSLGKYPLTICTPQPFELDIGNYRFIGTYLKTGEKLQSDINIVEGTNPQLDLTFQPVTYTLTISSAIGGTTTPATGTYPYTDGTTVQVMATPSSGYRFDHWTLDGTNYTSNPINVLMTTNHTLQAVFQVVPITLTISAGTNGSVSPSGTQSLIVGQNYSFVATPSIGYQVDRWELAGSNIGSSNPLSVTATSGMNGKSLVVYFTALPPQQVTITLAVTPSDGGSTTPSIGSHQFNIGDTIQVTASPAVDHLFVQWTLNGTTYPNNPLSLQITSNMNGKTLTAQFVIPQITITVVAGTNGSVSPSGSQILIIGHTYSFAATPNTGYYLDHWDLSGSNIGSTTPVSLTATSSMNGKTLTAIFAKSPVYFTLSISASQGGSTTPTSGDYSILENTSASVQATASSGYYFDHWELDTQTYTSNPISILMNQNHSLTPFFSQTSPPPPATYKLNLNTTDGGTTNPPAGIYDYTSGTSVTVTATPQTGYNFDHWNLDGTIKTQNPISIVMDTDHTLQAVLTAITPTKPAPPPMWLIVMPVAIAIGGVIYWFTKRKKH